jgi:hypothetical protein
MTGPGLPIEGSIAGPVLRFCHLTKKRTKEQESIYKTRFKEVGTIPTGRSRTPKSAHRSKIVQYQVWAFCFCESTPSNLLIPVRLTTCSRLKSVYRLLYNLWGNSCLSFCFYAFLIVSTAAPASPARSWKKSCLRQRRTSPRKRDDNVQGSASTDHCTRPTFLRSS